MLVSINNRKSVGSGYVNCVRRDYEPVVQNGLAMTPSDMQEMLSRGEAISAQYMQVVKEETLSARNDFEVPLEYTRGFDIVQGWNAMRDVQSKVRKVRADVLSGKIPQVTEDVV